MNTRIAYWLRYHHKSSSLPTVHTGSPSEIPPYQATVALILDNATSPPTIISGEHNLTRFRYLGRLRALPAMLIDKNGNIIRSRDRSVVLEGPSYAPQLPQLQPYQEAILKVFRP